MKASQPVAEDIDHYIAGCPKAVQAVLQQLRRTIQKAAPQAEEAISYCMPSFRLHGALVYFAAFNEHIGFYPTSSGTAQFKRELSAHDTSKGTVRFPYGRPIPHGLISRIVKFRVRENLARAAAKAKKKRTR